LAFLNVFRSLFRRAVDEQRLVRVVCLPSFMGNLTCTTQREKEKEKRMKWNDAGGGRTYCSLILAVKWSAALLPPPAELSAMLAHTWNIHITPFRGIMYSLRARQSRSPRGKKKERNKANPNNNRKSKKAGRSSSSNSSKCVGLGKRITRTAAAAAIA
jgi:hypothetical protein